MRNFFCIPLLWCFLSAAHAQETRPIFEFEKPAQAYGLPAGLLEISGLAADGDDFVFAHNDEFAIVYKINLKTGKLVSAFALGAPTAQADFEGIARNGDRIYLISSSGMLYESLIGKNRKRVRFNIFDTGAGAECEIEGLANGPQANEFLILCKTPRGNKNEQTLEIYKWNIDERRPVENPWIQIPYTEILDRNERDDFRPSAIEWDSATETIMILSARNGVYLSLTPHGKIIQFKKFPRADHNQAEGIAYISGKGLIIADEGSGRKPGMITVYKLKP